MAHRSRKRNVKRRKTIKKQLMRGGKRENCIFIHPKGGLGNQLYIYAAGMTAKNKLGIPLCALPAKESIHTDRDYRKLLFNNLKIIDPSDLEVNTRIETSKKLFTNLKDTYGKWSNSNIKKMLFKKNSSLNPKAYFQNYKAIEGVINEMRKEIIGSLKKICTNITNSFNSQSSAFMHVRRGDYMKVEGQVLSKEYYQNALDKICKLDGLKTIFIISNDIDWCKEKNFHVADGIKVEFNNDPDELKVFYIMCLCERAAIISASTFSTWGAIFGAQNHKDPMIIYPKKWWMHDDSSVLEFPADKGWIQM